MTVGGNRCANIIRRNEALIATNLTEEAPRGRE